MTYSSGGLIQATDYNNFVGSNPAIGTGTINAVWSTGSGAWGYGQTAVSQSAATGGTVTATQWATLINALNSTLIHQSGSGSGIAATTAGSTITYLNTLSTNIATAYTNARNFASNSAVVAGVGSATTTWTQATTSSTVTRSFGTRLTFPSADQARYFFNAGGRIKLNVSGALSGSTSTRSTEVVNLLTYLGGVGLFAANTNAGRLGTGGTLNTNDTTKGYWSATTSNSAIVAVTATLAPYTSDTASITYITNGLQGTNNDNGSIVDFWVNVTSTSGNASYSFNDDIGVNVVRSVDISYPESTNLANTWGAIAVTSL